jgi:hypothetical protein
VIVGSADGTLVVGILDGFILGNTVGAEVMNTFSAVATYP